MGRREDKAKARAGWYPISLGSLLAAAGYLIAIIVVPLARGRELTWLSIRVDLLVWALSLIGAALVAWLAWHATRRSSLVANLVLAGLMAAMAVWTVGLDARERRQAVDDMRERVGAQVNAIESQAHEVID